MSHFLNVPWKISSSEVSTLVLSEYKSTQRTWLFLKEIYIVWFLIEPPIFEIFLLEM